jgi:hypothetical protein
VQSEFGNGSNKDLIHEEIKRRLNLCNACYHSLWNLLSFFLLSEHTKIEIDRTIILSVVFYGCETWSLTSLEEHTLSVFKSKVPRRISGPKRNGIIGG